MIADAPCHEAAPRCRAACPLRPQESWRRYAAAGAGSAVEEELVERYLPLVKSVVSRLALTLPPHIDYDDLHSAGLVGLLDAVRRYDPACGTAFATYARLRVRGAVLDELRRLDWVPRSVHRKARRVEEVMRRLEQAKGAVPSATEMAAALHLTSAAYEQVLEEIRPATFVSLDSVRSQESEEARHVGVCLADEQQPDPSDRAADRELAECIAEQMQHLPKVQRQVLALYYFEDLRLREIAAAFGVTESRISQIHTQAVLALRAALKERDPLLV